MRERRPAGSRSRERQGNRVKNPYMKEKDILKKIEESAEDVKIPESLKPEKVAIKLAGKSVESHQNVENQPTNPNFVDKAAKKQENVEKPAEGKRVIHFLRKKSIASTAAAALFLCVLGSAAFFYGRTGENGAGTNGTIASGINGTSKTTATDNAGADEIIATGDTESTAYGQADTPKQDAGDLYLVASGYEEVYEKLEQYGLQENVIYDFKVSGIEKDEAAGTDATASQEDQFTMQSPVAESAADDSAGIAYTETNRQVQGVDESDIVKTDGEYLYVVDGEQVVILDIRDGMPKEAGKITFSSGQEQVWANEIYVDGNTLVLIAEEQSTSLENEAIPEEHFYEDSMLDTENPDEIAVPDTNGLLPLTDGTAVADMAYFVRSNYITTIKTYDITDRENPVLTGKIEQEGYYNTSRKIGDIVYLFTTQGLMDKVNLYAKEDAGKIIPLVNGEAVAEDSIYLPQGKEYWNGQGLVVSSVDMKSPSKTVDSMMIVNAGAEVYVGTDSLYLYDSDYSGEHTVTEIAKFSLKNGYMNAVGAATAPGQVQDTFAVSEQDGILRVLTTEWEDETENIFSIYKEDMTLTGRLFGIAEGEEVYAARYVGNMAYFVTYRNTDPLFVADLSDITNPVLCGAVELTGFSEYLHAWQEDTLLGIGYETDSETGWSEGVKLVMFDISNPAKPVVLADYVMEDGDLTPATWNYKCVLADSETGLIGFECEAYGNPSQDKYVLFSWENGNFVQLLSKEADMTNWEKYRGLYVGDFFYLVSPGEVVTFDRKNGYAECGSLNF